MADGHLSEVALLILRLSLGGVFLYAAWKNTENGAAWRWTITETSLLLRSWPADASQRLSHLCAIAGMIMMYGGGLSTLLGVEARLGALALVVFCLFGMRIHAIRRDEAKIAGEAGNAMGWSAYGAHIAAGLKNWALVGAAVLLFLTGAGRYALGPDHVGRVLGLTD